MTPKQLRDAAIELRDMAYEHERRAEKIDAARYDRQSITARAKLLRAVAAELEARLSEEQ